MKEKKEFTILVVDDDVDIANLVAIQLGSKGYKVETANDAQKGLDILKEQKIDLCILDIMMPGMNGYEMCTRIREKSNIPVIMLSAKGSTDDKIVGLGMGADDYLSKPFNPLELEARVESQLRRYTVLNNSENGDGKDVHLKHIDIEFSKKLVSTFGKERKLTPIEFDILYLLASHPGEVFTMDQIFGKVWEERNFEIGNTIMVHIRRIREKIEEPESDVKLIKTVWGVGYKVDENA